jgi:hypothetical protein
VKSPTRWESQENWYAFANTLYLALYQFTFHKPFDAAIDWNLRHKIENVFVEGDHRLNRCILNKTPKFIQSFRCYLESEKLVPKYLSDLCRVLGWKSIITIEDQLKGSCVLSFEANFSKAFWIAVFLGYRQSACSFHYRPEIILAPFGIG